MGSAAVHDATRGGFAVQDLIRRTVGICLLLLLVLTLRTGTTPTTLRATLLREGAAPLTADFAIGAGARHNVDVPGLFPQTVGARFGMLLEPAPAAPSVPLVVEWAHYADNAGVHWSAGAAALGTCVP